MSVFQTDPETNLSIPLAACAYCTPTTAGHEDDCPMNPNRVVPRKTIFDHYPLPWTRGVEHETMIEIIAANGAKFTINSGWCTPNLLGGKIIDVFNAFHGEQDEPT